MPHIPFRHCKFNLQGLRISQCYDTFASRNILPWLCIQFDDYSIAVSNQLTITQLIPALSGLCLSLFNQSCRCIVLLLILIIGLLTYCSRCQQMIIPLDIPLGQLQLCLCRVYLCLRIPDRLQQIPRINRRQYLSHMDDLTTLNLT